MVSTPLECLAAFPQPAFRLLEGSFGAEVQIVMGQYASLCHVYQLVITHPDDRLHIHILDNDSLLNIFRLCRPVLLDEDKEDGLHILEGGEWDRERWWYKLTQVCRR